MALIGVEGGTDLYADDIARHTVRSGEIVIELDNEHTHTVTRLEINEDFPLDIRRAKKRTYVTTHGNRHMLFPPCDVRSENGMTATFIRTRNVLVRNGLEERFSMHPALREIDYICGERIHIHLDDKIGRITDGNFDADERDLRERLMEAAQKIHGRLRPWLPSPYHEVDLSRDPKAFWNWCWHMRRIMDGDTEHCSGPPQHLGCATSGPRLCRPVQNVDQMPTRLEIIRSGHIIMPVKRMTKEEWDRFESDRKERDPDYTPSDMYKGEVVLTPWLAGELAS